MEGKKWNACHKSVEVHSVRSVECMRIHEETVERHDVLLCDSGSVELGGVELESENK